MYKGFIQYYINIKTVLPKQPRLTDTHQDLLELKKCPNDALLIIRVLPNTTMT